MANLQEPILRTRFTDMTAAMFTHQKNEVCKDFELRFVYCMEAYGRPLGDTKCQELKDDLNECVFKNKQVCYAVPFIKNTSTSTTNMSLFKKL